MGGGSSAWRREERRERPLWGRKEGQVFVLLGFALEVGTFRRLDAGSAQRKTFLSQFAVNF